MAKNIFQERVAFDPALLIGGMVEALHGLLVVVDQEYRVHLSNLPDKGSDSGAAQRELPLCYQALRHRSSPCRPCYAKKVFQTNHPLQVEHHDQQTGRIEDIQLSPLKDRFGRTVAVVEHIVDVSDRRKAQGALKRTSDANAVLSWLGGELLRVSDRRELSRAVLGCALEATGSRRGLVGVVPRGKAGQPQITAELWNDDQKSSGRATPGPNAVLEVLWDLLGKESKTLMSNDRSGDPLLAALQNQAMGLERLLCMPVVIEDKLLGLVVVADAARRYDSHDLSFFKRIADLFAMAIRHLQDDEEVLAHQSRLRDLAAQLSVAEEIKGRAIAEDLHDSVGQYLSMASQRLKMLRVDQPPPPATLDQIIDLIDRAIDQTRSLTVQLSPPVLHLLGLEAAVEWLAENSAKSLGLAIEVSDDGRQKPLDERIRVFVFRAIMELLRNVAKHSGSQEAQVDLAREGDRLSVTVKDQGRGFDAKAGLPFDGSSFGLFSIEQRIMSLGGSFQVKSRPGQGTEAVMLVPLAETRAESE